MRKWYGQGDRMPTDGGGPDRKQGGDEGEEPEAAAARDCVLVTDAESATGEQVVLQLILQRSKLKVLVRDVAKAKASYGAYVSPLPYDASSPGLSRQLKTAKTIVCLGKLGSLPAAAATAGVEHIVLLSTAGGSGGGGGLGGLFASAEATTLKDPAREAAVKSCGVPYTIVRVSSIADVPGGRAGLSLLPSGASPSGSGGGAAVSREDVAAVVAQAATNFAPPAGHAVELTVVSSSAAGGLAQSASPTRAQERDWQSLFSQLQPQPL